MADRIKGYYEHQISEKKRFLHSLRLDDYESRARVKLEIEELECKANGIPWLDEYSNDELEEERRKLEKYAFGTAAILFPGKAEYSHAKRKKIYDILASRRLEEKKKQEIESEIFSKSDFVPEERPTQPAETATIDEAVFKQLTEYTVQVWKELYRYGMDYDLIKRAYGERMIPVLPLPTSEDESYYTFEYFTDGSRVARIFRSQTNLSEEEVNSIRNDADYRKLVTDKVYRKHLLAINMTVEELAEKFLSHSITIDYVYITGNSYTARFRRNFSQTYYTNPAGSLTMDEMKDQIKNYFLGTINLSADLF
jgi:hypothetical protein